MSSAGDGLRFYDLERLAPLGGWKTSSISEITSFLHNGLNYFLFGSNSSFLCVLTEAEMLAHSQGKMVIIQTDSDSPTSIASTTGI